jgi:hypothetical protein
VTGTGAWWALGPYAKIFGDEKVVYVGKHENFNAGLLLKE